MTYQADLFAGKRALVTGGTTGIGAAIAARFASLGAQVVAAGLAAPAGTPEPPAGVTTASLDVADAAGIARVIGGFASLDIVVNCAGVIRRQAELDPEAFAQVIDINLNGTMRVCAAARPLLATARGCIINTASMLSFFGGGLVPGYSASKGGVAQLTKSLAIAYAADGIRVNAVAPGWIATALTQALQDDPVRSGPILDRTPMKRWGRPQEVADAAVFLATPAAGFMTGVIMPVDGGYLIT